MVECDTAFQILVKKPHTTSSMWAQFGLKGDEKGLPIPDEVDKPVCRHCKKVVLAKRQCCTARLSPINVNRLVFFVKEHVIMCFHM